MRNAVVRAFGPLREGHASDVRDRGGWYPRPPDRSGTCSNGHFCCEVGGEVTRGPLVGVAGRGHEKGHDDRGASDDREAHLPAASIPRVHDHRPSQPYGRPIRLLSARDLLASVVKSDRCTKVASAERANADKEEAATLMQHLPPV